MINHLFPFEKIPKDSKIILYGLGVVGNEYISQIQKSNFCEIVMGVDKNYNNLYHLTIPVGPPECVKDVPCNYIVIANDCADTAEEIIKYIKQITTGQKKEIVYLNQVVKGDEQQVFSVSEEFHSLSETCFKEKHIPVIGDSHVNFFSGNDQMTLRKLVDFPGGGINHCQDRKKYCTLHVGPALAVHLDTYGSTCMAREKIDFLCKMFLHDSTPVIFSFGEIDLRVHILKYAKARECGFQKIVDEVLEHYLDFLRNMKRKGYRPIVWGPIASQPDDLCRYDKNFPRYGRMLERNNATKYFTRRLENLCREEHIGFLSIFNELIDANGCTKTNYYEDGCHLNQLAMPLFEKKMEQLLKEGIL